MLAGHLLVCRFEDAFPGTPYDLVVDTMGGDYELRRCGLLQWRGQVHRCRLWECSQGWSKSPAALIARVADHDPFVVL